MNGMVTGSSGHQLAGRFKWNPRCDPARAHFLLLRCFVRSFSLLCVCDMRLALICNSYFGLSRSEEAPLSLLGLSIPQVSHQPCLPFFIDKFVGCGAAPWLLVRFGGICVAFEIWRHFNLSNVYLRIVSRTIAFWRHVYMCRRSVPDLKWRFELGLRDLCF